MSIYQANVDICVCVAVAIYKANTELYWQVASKVQGKPATALSISPVMLRVEVQLKCGSAALYGQSLQRST